VSKWPKSKYGLLREAIQATLQSNKPDPRLLEPGKTPKKAKRRGKKS
jgi:hypothetical protein